jgi:hypothetical protein
MRTLNAFLHVYWIVFVDFECVWSDFIPLVSVKAPLLCRRSQILMRVSKKKVSTVFVDTICIGKRPVWPNGVSNLVEINEKFQSQWNFYEL